MSMDAASKREDMDRQGRTRTDTDNETGGDGHGIWNLW